MNDIKWEDIPDTRGDGSPYFTLNGCKLKIESTTYQTQYSIQTTHSRFFKSYEKYLTLDCYIDLIPTFKFSQDDNIDDKYLIFDVRGWINFNLPLQDTLPTIVGGINVDKRRFDDLLEIIKINKTFNLGIMCEQRNQSEPNPSNREDWNPPLLIKYFDFSK